jgi:uroporphyrinogen-III synthase
VIAGELRKIFAEKKILIPRAKDSLLSVENQLSGLDIESIIVYETSPVENVTINPCDIIIFTSPSGVSAFMSKHQISAQEVVAIGTSTAKALEDSGIKEIKIANTPDETGLAECIFAL